MPPNSATPCELGSHTCESVEAKPIQTHRISQNLGVSSTKPFSSSETEASVV